MKMTEPYLSLHINDGILYISKKLATEIKPRVILDVEVGEVVSDDFDEAARKLGTTVLGILCLWYKTFSTTAAYLWIPQRIELASSTWRWI